MENLKIKAINAPAFMKHLANLSYLSGGLVPYPFDIYAKLKRLERKANRISTQECNGEINEDKADKQLESIKKQVLILLPVLPESLFFINGDPRGYSLKIKESFATEINMYKDWGGYGILAPDFN
jgi:hypothetical protein